MGRELGGLRSVTLKSMTGFARGDGMLGDTRWNWEARSVNGRTLDLRFRLPTGFEALEIRARGLAQEKTDRVKAISDIKKALELDPKNAIAQEALKRLGSSA